MISRGQDKIQQHGTVSPMTRSLGIEAQRDVLMQRALCSHTAKHNNVGKDNVQKKKIYIYINIYLYIYKYIYMQRRASSFDMKLIQT